MGASDIIKHPIAQAILSSSFSNKKDIAIPKKIKNKTKKKIRFVLKAMLLLFFINSLSAAKNYCNF